MSTVGLCYTCPDSSSETEQMVFGKFQPGLYNVKKKKQEKNAIKNGQRKIFAAHRLPT
jgi:hypothetical protein